MQSFRVSVRTIGVWLVPCALFATRVAHAQSAQDKAAAEALYDQAKPLMAQGKYGEACPKLEESLRLDTGIGTMLHLADCYEKNGQLASAWAQFREAADVARKQGDPRDKVARGRAGRLDGRVAKIVIVVPTQNAEVTITRDDGVVIRPALWGSELPVDPGVHRIAAAAAGKRTWSTTVTVPPRLQVIRVLVPVLEDEPAPKVVVASPVVFADETTAKHVHVIDEDTSWKPQRWIGVAMGTLGVVGIGIGTGFGVDAISKNNASNANGHCISDNQCDAEGVSLRGDALTAATVSTVGFIAGGALLAGGIVLFVTAPTKPKQSVAFAPSFGTDRASLLVQGRF